MVEKISTLCFYRTWNLQCWQDLKSEVAVAMNLKIVDVFVTMRKYLTVSNYKCYCVRLLHRQKVIRHVIYNK